MRESDNNHSRARGISEAAQGCRDLSQSAGAGLTPRLTLLRLACWWTYSVVGLGENNNCKQRLMECFNGLSPVGQCWEKVERAASWGDRVKSLLQRIHNDPLVCRISHWYNYFLFKVMKKAASWCFNLPMTYMHQYSKIKELPQFSLPLIFFPKGDKKKQQKTHSVHVWTPVVW